MEAQQTDAAESTAPAALPSDVAELGLPPATRPTRPEAADQLAQAVGQPEQNHAADFEPEPEPGPEPGPEPEPAPAPAPAPNAGSVQHPGSRGSTQSTEESLFERRGVSLEVMERLVEVAEILMRCPRVLLVDGSTAVQLPWSATDTHVLVQRRQIDPSSNRIVREHECVAVDQVACTIPAAVGDRVLLSTTEPPVTGTVTSVGEDTCTLVECSIPSLYHEANHALPFAKGAERLLQPHDIIQLDTRFTTKDVCEELVKPLTRPKLESMVDMLFRAQELPGGTQAFPVDFVLHGPAAAVVAACTGQPVGDATDFASHAWKYRFVDLTRGVESYFQQDDSLDRSSTWFWLDICTVNQHPEAQQSLPADYFYTTFREGISTIGRTVLILLPWHDPLPLTRSWCLWEIVSTAAAGAKLSVVLSPNEVNQFERALGADFERIEKMMDQIDVANSEAFHRSDQERILAAAEGTSGGVQMLNTEIKRQLRTWLARVTRELADRMLALVSEDGRRPCCDDQTTVLAPELQANNLLQGAADLQVHLGNYQEALPLFSSCYELRERLHGPEHVDTLTAGEKLATCMWCCNDVVAADSLLSATLERRLRLLGESHEDTLHTMASLGQMRHQQLRVDEATKLLEKALAGQMRLLGDQHPHTMQTMMAIANLKSLAEMSNDQDGHTLRQGRVSLAERVYRVLRDTKGALHIETLSAAQTWLGSALGLGVALSEAERAELEEQLQQAMAEAKEAVGSTHRIHVGLASMLRSSMLVRGSQDEAAEFMRTLQMDMDQDVRLLERMFGSTHLRTRCGVQESANCLRDSGDYAAQIDVLHELVDRTVRAVGVLDPETFNAKAQLATAFSGCGKPDKATQVYEELFPQQQRVLGPLDTATLDTHRMYAHALISVDPYKAEPVFRSLREATNM